MRVSSRCVSTTSARHALKTRTTSQAESGVDPECREVSFRSSPWRPGNGIRERFVEYGPFGIEPEVDNSVRPLLESKIHDEGSVEFHVALVAVLEQPLRDGDKTDIPSRQRTSR
jgi:hypothetical protein